MITSLSLRLRRLAHSLAEPSGWRSLRFMAGLAPAARGALTVPAPGTVQKIVPAEPQRFDRIAPIIFQTWKSRTEIPANYRYWRQTFVTKNPDAQVVLWDDDDNRAFIAENFAWFLPVYDRFPKEIFRADAVRYFFLYAFGGLYADMDSECLKPLRLGLRKDAVLLGRMGFDPGFEHSVPNALMASRPGQAFWLLVIRRMLDVVAEYSTAEALIAAGPEQLTGPILVKRSFDEFQELDEAGLMARIAPVLDRLDDRQKGMMRIGRITLLDRNRWYPLDWTNLFHKKLRNYLDRKTVLLPPHLARWIFPQAELVTYWSHSWSFCAGAAVAGRPEKRTTPYQQVPAQAPATIMSGVRTSK
jgi:hypothetical protein